MEWSPRQYLIAFNMIPGIGGRRLKALLEFFKSPDRAWAATEKELCAVGGIGKKTAAAFLKRRREVCPLKEEEWAQRLNARIITCLDGDYPELLERLAVPPPVLYVAGTLPQKPGIAVVGTRKPSRSGIAQARLFSGYLAVRGEAVVSGLARGIDYFAHAAALEEGGSTVAVLGSNLAELYPREHGDLARKISERGALISEFSSRCRTVPGNFPRRNRIIAGLSRGVLVVQAAARSGALITADWALELGLDVWAIPGEISDPLRGGCHGLIKQGAYLVTDPAELYGAKPPPQASPSIAQLYAAGRSANEIAASLDLPISQVLAEITVLEIEGIPAQRS